VTSLRSRVRTVLALVFFGCWIAGGGALVANTLHAGHSVWDGKMEAFANKLMMAIPADKIDQGPFGPGLQLPADKIQTAENFSFQVWTGQDRLFIKTPGVPSHPFRPRSESGFSSTVIDGEKWRVYSVSDRTGQVTIQVANLQRVLDWELQCEALIALTLLTAVLAVVGLVIEYALSRALRPLAGIGAAVLQRRDFDLTPLPYEELPSELSPLVQSFNHMLRRLDGAVESERRFIGDAAHELRTPLAALQAQAEVALAATAPADKDKALVKLLAVARRSTRLAEQLLDLARLDAGGSIQRATAVDLRELVGHVAHEYEFDAEQNQRALVLATSACRIVGDIDEIAILLRNLVDNALRYAPQGGQVRIACGHAGENAPASAWLEVADDGPGVAPEERQVIFQRFHRAASGSRGRGSGIGLSLVAAIARLHQARIVTGEGLAGRGFSVRVIFPAPAGASQPA
jgi:signal transduction histidine kinase